MYSLNLSRLIVWLFFGILALAAFNVSAEMEYRKYSEHKGPMHSMGPAHRSDEDMMRHSRVHAAWRATLSDEQQQKIDVMHLALMKDQQLLRARVKLYQVELNQLALHDTPDMSAIRAKIADITDLKGKLMLNRYRHITEMRQVLTGEQRISFDQSVLRGKHGGHQSHRKD